MDPLYRSRTGTQQLLLGSTTATLPTLREVYTAPVHLRHGSNPHPPCGWPP
jgi:hypothetical protein